MTSKIWLSWWEIKSVYRPAQATPGLLQTNKNQTNIAENNIKFDNNFTQEATVLHTHWLLFYCAYWFLFYYPHMLTEIVVSRMHDFHPEIVFNKDVNSEIHSEPWIEWDYTPHRAASSPSTTRRMPNLFFFFQFQSQSIVPEPKTLLIMKNSLSVPYFIV